MEEPLIKNKPIPNEIIKESETLLIDTTIETTIATAIIADPYAVTSEIWTGFQPRFRATGDNAVNILERIKCAIDTTAVSLFVSFSILIPICYSIHHTTKFCEKQHRDKFTHN